MRHNNDLDVLPKLKRPSINPFFLFLLVGLIAVVGSALVFRFVSLQKERELLSWQNRLNLIADSRVADIDAWLDRHFKELSHVAANPSLQLYLAEILKAPKVAPHAEEPAQAVFLRNLLSMTAEKLGFTEKRSTELSSIMADVKKPQGLGIAILSPDGKTLVSTVGLPELGEGLTRKIQEMQKAPISLIDLFRDENGDRRMGFVVPVYPIDADPATSPEIAKLVAIKSVENDLLNLLRHPGVTESSLEAVLLRKEGENVVFLSKPNPDNKQAFFKLALNTPELDAAYALASRGTFGVKLDSEGRASLTTSREVPRSPWILMQHVDSEQALGESNRWLRQIEYSLFLALLAVIGGIVAVWYYGTSKRTLALSLHNRQIAEKAAAQERLLRVATDSLIEPVVIVDENNIAHFANATAAKAFRIRAVDIAGKSLEALMGHAFAKGYEEANKEALSDQAPHARIWSAEAEGGRKIIRSEHIPLDHVPVQGLPTPTRGVLMIDQDITEIVNEREQRMLNLHQIIDMLVHLVDRRDPFAASHSACVALVARSTALAMGVEPKLVETAEVAGKLMNIGKIDVPSELLTKAAALTEKEHLSINESLLGSVALLEKINFDGPVAETLRESQERFDGRGPLGLQADRILVTARIIAVANAFVGMISHRSYRPAKTMDEAIKILMDEINSKYDRRVVVALVNYLDNRRGRDEVEKIIPAEF